MRDQHVVRRYLRTAALSTALSIATLGCATVVAAQSDTAAKLAGQRVVMLQGYGAVHLGEPSEAPQTRVGINLVMPVRRVDGQRVWVVSTSGGDSGWVDVGSVRLLGDAAAYFDTLLARDPRNWDAYLRRAETEHALNRRDAATADYSRAIELHPNEAFLYLRRGRHYHTLKECAKEIADFQRAIDLAPRSLPQDYNLVAEIHSLESGVYFACPDTTFRDYARGLALAKQAVAEDPSRATLETILAAAYAQAGDAMAAVNTQRRALARPDFPPAYRAEGEQALAKYVAAAERHFPDVAPTTRVRLLLPDSLRQAPFAPRKQFVIGRFVRATADSVYLQMSGAAPIGVARAGVPMWVSLGASRSQSALRTGVAFGLFSAAVVYTSGKQGRYHQTSDAMVGGAIGLGAGVIVGAASPWERWRRIRDP